MKIKIENIDRRVVADYCRNKCTTQEKKEIEEAMIASTSFREEVQAAQEVLSLMTDLEQGKRFDAKKNYTKMRKKCRKIQIHKQFMRIAAILLIPLLSTSIFLSFLYFNKLNKEQTKASYAEVFSQPGTVVCQQLPDGTKVWLNASSHLKYPTRFKGDIREVHLQGEAYFEVKSDKKHPFYVSLENGMKVYAYGTKFNVNAYKDNAKIEAVLERGHINVILPYDKREYRLTPGQGVFYEKEKKRALKKEVNIYEKTAWREGKLVFRNTPLQEVLKRLSRTYNVKITFNNKMNKTYSYRATFKDETITQILEYLSKSANLTWKMFDIVQKEDSTFTKKEIVVTLNAQR